MSDRPDSIVWFERLYLGSLLVGIANAFLQLDDAGGSLAVTLLILAIMTSLPLLLVVAVARWRSNVAKWIFVVFTALGYALIAANVGSGGLETWTAFDFLIAAVQLVALALLFTPSARAWLTGAADDESALNQTFE